MIMVEEQAVFKCFFFKNNLEQIGVVQYGY